VKKNSQKISNYVISVLLIIASIISLSVLRAGFAGETDSINEIFKTPIQKEIKEAFFRSAPFYLKPPFGFAYKIDSVINLDKYYQLYKNNPSYEQDYIKEYEERMNYVGHCKLNGENGSWEVWIYIYTWFGYSEKYVLTCNNGLS